MGRYKTTNKDPYISPNRGQGLLVEKNKTKMTLKISTSILGCQFCALCDGRQEEELLGPCVDIYHRQEYPRQKGG